MTNTVRPLIDAFTKDASEAGVIKAKSRVSATLRKHFNRERYSKSDICCEFGVEIGFADRIMDFDVGNIELSKLVELLEKVLKKVDRDTFSYIFRDFNEEQVLGVEIALGDDFQFFKSEMRKCLKS